MISCDSVALACQGVALRCSGLKRVSLHVMVLTELHSQVKVLPWGQQVALSCDDAVLACEVLY